MYSWQEMRFQGLEIFSRKMILSILTPAVPSRMLKLDWLCSKIHRQIGDSLVEHLVLMDNKRRTVGAKRDALLRAAKGKYVAFVDDDDDISEDYVKEILDAAKQDPDVITFCQVATIDGSAGMVEFKLGNPNEAFKACDFSGGLWTERVRRDAWHVCAWRRTLAIYSKFPNNSYGEDWAYASRLCAMAQSEVHIPKILHYYNHSSTTTEAPVPGVSIVNDTFHVVTGK